MNNYYLNGVPKSGNHALSKVFELLGVATPANHTTRVEGVPNDTTHHIFIKRDPRNVLISHLRFVHTIVGDASIIAAMHDFYGDTFVNTLAKYEPWLTHPNTLVVKFEDMTTDGGVTIKQIADYCGIPYIQEAYDNLYGGTMTWTGRLSDYREYWTEAVQKEWESIDGVALLERWGYTNDVPRVRTELTPQGLIARPFGLRKSQTLTRGADIAHETAVFSSGSFQVKGFDKRCGCKSDKTYNSQDICLLEKEISYEITCTSEEGQLFLIENVLYNK